jgi:hypothetical protein
MSLTLWVFRKEWLFVNRQNEKSDAPAGTTLSAKPHRALRSLSGAALSSTVSKSSSSVSPQCPVVNVQHSRLGVFNLRAATVQLRRRRAFNSCAVFSFFLCGQGITVNEAVEKPHFTPKRLCEAVDL